MSEMKHAKKDSIIGSQNKLIDELIAENIYLRNRLNIYEESERIHAQAWDEANKKVEGRKR